MLTWSCADEAALGGVDVRACGRGRQRHRPHQRARPPADLPPGDAPGRTQQSLWGVTDLIEQRQLISNLNLADIRHKEDDATEPLKPKNTIFYILLVFVYN